MSCYCGHKQEQSSEMRTEGQDDRESGPLRDRPRIREARPRVEGGTSAKGQGSAY